MASNQSFFQQTVESSKIILQILEDESKFCQKKNRNIVDKLRFVFTSAAEEKDDLEYCLAKTFNYLYSNNIKSNIKYSKNLFEIYSESEITQEDQTKASLAIKKAIDLGFNKDLKPSDLYLESSLN